MRTLKGTDLRGYIQAGAVFAVCLLLTALASGIFIQILFPYGGFYLGDDRQPQWLFGPMEEFAFAALQWAVIGTLFAWFARRLNLGVAIGAAFAVIATASVLVLTAFSLFGARHWFDAI